VHTIITQVFVNRWIETILSYSYHILLNH